MKSELVEQPLKKSLNLNCEQIPEKVGWVGTYSSTNKKKDREKILLGIQYGTYEFKEQEKRKQTADTPAGFENLNEILRKQDDYGTYLPTVPVPCLRILKMNKILKGQVINYNAPVL